ncbi:MAG: NYN domain-containing protein [Dehalogenimonas sp.]|uniref:NYN domain-containing protein n=1 Tax=Candidatus Dehalogenimonas loeffleri TaxID=3127115 RepID=A0ABZ2J383_9CHLR|nr:NYN domain-containing protein [Dehalogenimonas sp.]
MNTNTINSDTPTNNYAFIDSQNLNLAIRDQGWTLDFLKYRQYLTKKYGITKAFLFIGFAPENQNMYTNLQKNGYVLVFKPTLKLPDGKVKGNVDAELVLHTMIEFANFDQALIVTGDGDFFCLVDYLHRKNKLLKLMIPNQYKYSSLLRGLMSHIVFMNNLRKILEYK